MPVCYYTMPHKNYDICARREFVRAGEFVWIPQVYIESVKQWFDLTNAPRFKNPDEACRYGLDEFPDYYRNKKED